MTSGIRTWVTTPSHLTVGALIIALALGVTGGAVPRPLARPGHPRGLAGRCRRAVVLAGPAADPVARGRPGLLPDRRVRQPGRLALAAGSQSHGAAGALALAARRRPAHPHRPHVDGRGARQGLRAHRDRRRPAAHRGGRPQRAAQRADQPAHRAGPAGRLPAGRRGRHRDDLRRCPAWAAHDQTRVQQNDDPASCRASC